jgi:hypothetical protein
MNLTLRRVVNSGMQFDINYTHSKSTDVGSNAERINVFDTNGTNVGGFSSQVINSWQPNARRAVFDFDITPQLNSNWVIDLPVGRGRRFAGNMGGWAMQFLEGGACPDYSLGRADCPAASSPAEVGPRITT